jgi:hypothetical protein
LVIKNGFDGLFDFRIIEEHIHLLLNGDGFVDGEGLIDFLAEVLELFDFFIGGVFMFS